MRIDDKIWEELPNSGGTIQLENGSYEGDLVWPDIPNVTLVGRGKDATTIEGSIRFPGGKRIPNWRIADLSVHGQGSGTGIHVIDGDRGEIERVRCTVWETCIKIDSTINLGALHNDIIRCRITNAGKIGLHLTGAQGPHQTHVHGGEISICKQAGLQVDGPTDNSEVLGTSFESNKQAMWIAGVRAHYIGVRFEGNEMDCHFAKGSAYNTLSSGFFDADRHTDDNRPSSNRVLPYGFWTSTTEHQPMLYIPSDPMVPKLEPCIPGARHAISHLFEVYEMFWLESVSFVPTGAGKVDIAICDLDGKPLMSTGPVEVGATERSQTVPFPKRRALGPGRRYYVVIMGETGNVGFYGIKATQAGFQLGQGNVLARDKALPAWPIGAQDCVSGGSGTTTCPAVSLS